MEFEWKNEPFGKYALKGYRKWMYDIAQRLPRNKFCFKLGLVLRKLTLLNRLKVIDAEPLGLKARFYPLDNLGDRQLLFLPKYFEFHEFALMNRVIKEDSVFIDIGANSGMYSLMAAKRIRSGKILAFEPNPIMASRMRTNMSWCDKGDVIELFELGIAAEEGEFDLYLDPKNLGGSSMVVQDRTEVVKIKCYPLYDFVREKVSRIDILKIDIEGMDSVVMNQFFKDAPRELYPKILFIETDNIQLEQFGYRRMSQGRGQNAIYLLN